MGIKEKIIRALGGVPRVRIEREKEESEERSVDKEKQEVSIGKSERSVNLALYDKIVRIEEISRIIEEKLDLIEKTMSTREDSRQIIDILRSGAQTQSNINNRLEDIDEKIESLRKLRSQFTGQLTETTRQLTELTKEKTIIDRNLRLLEAHKRILESLKAARKSSTDLSKELGYSRQYIWERLQELKASGYVNSTRVGRKTVYFINMGNTSTDTSGDMSTDIVDE